MRFTSVAWVVALSTAGRASAGPPAATDLPIPATNGSNGESEQPEPIHAEVGEFPKAHPLVERALEDMPSELNALKGQQHDTDQEHNRLASSVDEAISRTNDIPHLRSEIVKKEADIREQERRLSRLTAEEKRLKRSHSGLTARLHAVLDPKVSAAEQHLVQQQAKLAKSDKQLIEWKGAVDKSRQVALAELQEKRHNQEMLHESEASLAQAQRRQEEAQALYDASRTTVEKDVESFRYVQTKYEGVLDREQARTAKTRLQEKSVKNLRGVLNMEEKRIKESYTQGAERLQGRISHAQGRLWSSRQKLAFQKEQYAKWRAGERARIQETVARKEAYEASATAYASKRRSVFESAEAQAAKKAEHASDFASDDWAWGDKGPGEGDDADLDEA